MEVMFMQVFEHRDSVEAQMRQQVASSSDSLACTLLAAGSRLPSWLVPHPASAVGTQGNILRKQSLDLANLKREDVVHFAPPTSHKVSKPKSLEFGAKPGSCNTTGSSETINQCNSCISETILTKFTSMHPLNEDLSSTISLEASLQEVFHSVSSPLPEKETTHAAENYSLEGPSSMASPLLENDSLQSIKPNFLEEIDCAVGPMPEKDTIHTAEIDFLEGPTCGAPEILGSPQKNTLYDDGGRSPHPKKNMLEDGCRHDSHSHVCGAFNTCSLQSAANLEKLLPKSTNDEHLYQNNILFPGKINHNDSCSASASDASISARNERFQVQTSLPKLSPEFDRTVDIHTESSSLSTSNKSLQIEPVVDSVSCHLKQSGHADSKILLQSEAYEVSVRNNMDECVTAAVMGGAASEGAQILQTAERNSATSAKEYLGSLWHEELHASSSTTVYDKQIQSSQTSARHLPHCSGSGKMVASFKSDVQSTLSHRNRSIADAVQTQVNSSCERLVMNCRSSSNVSLVPQYSQSHYLENNLDKVSNSLANYSDTSSDGDACCITKKISCFAYPDTDVKVATVEDKIFTGIDCAACESGVLNRENYSITTSPTTFPRYALYQKNQHAGLEFDVKGIDDGQQVSNGAIPWQNVDIYADYDETEQQYQSFSIPIPSKTKSSTVKERAFVGLCESAKLIDLSCNLSRKYKMDSEMKPLCGVYESLAARFEKLVNRCSIDSVDTKWHDPSYAIDNLRVSGKHSMEFGDSLLMSNVLTYDSANANSVQEDNDIPLTLSVEKYSLEKMSLRTGSNSECMGSITELACFQIHEDSNIAEENKNKEMLPGCPGTNHSTQDLTDRKPLDHVTSSYQSRENKTSLSTRYVDVGGPGLIMSKAYSMDPDRLLHIRTDQAMKNPKANCASSIRKGKVSQPLHDRASRAELLNRKNARHRSDTDLGKGWKPSNIVTNMTPFVPLVKQNQQFRTACVKKDIRVKALEAAEAAKRRQEKKQNERDTHKAAAELEREKLKQAREQKQKQKQKQVEQKNKIDTDIVTRKRQRGDDENKEKGRKKKCTEGAQIPEQQMDQMHATNGKKDDCRKNYDDKEPRKELVRGLKHKFAPGERTESVHRFIASESNDLKAVVADGRPESSALQVQEIFSDDVGKSYEMSPCKDSDEEDNDDVEHQEELRRRRKLIPSWSREENLDKILLSNQSLDPAEIFARNGCFSLSDVLALHVPQRRFN